MVTHIVGGALGIAALILCTLRAAKNGTGFDILGSVIFGAAMILLYTVSSVYHGLHRGTGKKVLQVLDHCTIYVLIAGTYTPILISAVMPAAPAVAWGLLAAEWLLAALAVTLTAIDLKRYRAFSMVCYIGLGWGILPFLGIIWRVMGRGGFFLLLSGGIAYTVGAVLYGIGSKKPWFHSVFHLFVLLGSILHALAVLRFALPA